MEDAPRIPPAELIVKSKVKHIAGELDMRIADEVWKELGHVLTRHLKRAATRAKANGRKTIKAQDI